MVARTHIIDTESCCSQKKLCVCKVPMLSGALDIGSSYILDYAWFSQALLGDCDGSVTAHAPASDARTSSVGRGIRSQRGTLETFTQAGIGAKWEETPGRLIPQLEQVEKWYVG